MPVSNSIKRLFQHQGARILLAGAAFSTSFAPLFWWPLGLVILVYLCWLIIHATTARQAFLAGWLFGFGHMLTSMYWLPRSFYVDSGGDIGFMLYAGVPALIVLCAYLALYFALPGYVLTKLKLPAWAIAPTFSLLWLGMELLRSIPSINVPWNLLGYMWANDEKLMQLAHPFTVYGIGALVVLCCMWWAQGPRKGALPLAILLIGASVYGSITLNKAATTTPAENALDVLLIQPNLETAHNWDPQKRYDYLQHHMLLTQQNIAPSTTLVIWPETAVAYALDEDERLRRSITRPLAANQYLLAGFVRQEKTADGYDFYNSIALLDNTGTIIGQYDKRILVPFGEYIPLYSIFKGILRTMAFNRGSFKTGEKPALISLPQGTAHLMPLICYEAIFPWYVHKHRAAKHTHMVQITNDAWFDGTTALAQHAAMARMRAVEQRLPLIRVANTGNTIIVNAYGQLMATAPARTSAILKYKL